MKLPLHLPPPPRPLVAVLLLLFVGSLVPLTLFLMHTASFHEAPRIHLFQDMDNQVKFKAQSASALFADSRAMRPQVPGAVGRGQLRNDDHRNRGFELAEASNQEGQEGQEGQTAAESGVETRYLSGFPEGLEVDERFVRHGQDRYEAMCSLCHGLDGRGNGPVHQRAQQLMTSGRGLGTAWVPPASLLKVEEGRLSYGHELYPEGELFNTITNGKGAMTGYGHAIPVEDRWAIVAWIRALQDAQEDEILADAATTQREAGEAGEAGVEGIPNPVVNPDEPDQGSIRGRTLVPDPDGEPRRSPTPDDDAGDDAKAPA